MPIATVTVAAGGEHIRCRAGESTTCVFNVANKTGERLRISIRVMAEPPAKDSWFTIDGGNEHDLAPDVSDQITLRLKVPKDAAPGSSAFRVQVYSTADTEQSVDSPAVALEVPAPPGPTPEPGPEPKPAPDKRFPWWVVAVVAGVLVLGGVLAAVFWPRGIEVPDVVGLSLDGAKDAIAEVGLAVALPPSTAETDQQAPDTVLGQTPDPGAKVKKGSEIKLTVAVPAKADSESLCIASGLIKGGGWALLADLPPACAPAGELIFNLNNHTKTARVDVKPSGELFWVAGGADHGWISLDGVVLKPGEGGEALKLQNGWVNYAGAYRKARVARVGDLCVVSGLIKGGAWSTLAVLPEDCRPEKRLIFNLNNHVKTARVDVKPSGEILWVAGGKDYGWISLDGIVFETGKGGDPLALHNNWVNFGGEYREARVTRFDDLCIVSGLIKSGSWGSLAVLPEACRPAGRLIFNLNNHESTARVDVTANGEILWVTGGKNHGWISLSGIVFRRGKGDEPLLLLNNWKDFGGEYRPATVSEVSLRGRTPQ